MKQLKRDLGRIFGTGKSSAGKPPAKDSCRKAREEAKDLAARYQIEIERLRDGGMNVWAPAALDTPERDPFYGDHFADDWASALVMVQAYVAILSAKAAAGDACTDEGGER